jgi:hypothetical protein
MKMPPPGARHDSSEQGCGEGNVGASSGGSIMKAPHNLLVEGDILRREKGVKVRISRKRKIRISLPWHGDFKHRREGSVRRLR